jgi:hypothetical protein
MQGFQAKKGASFIVNSGITACIVALRFHF